MGHKRKRRATDQVAPAQGTSSRGYATSAQDNLNLYSIARETNAAVKRALLGFMLQLAIVLAVAALKLRRAKP